MKVIGQLALAGASILALSATAHAQETASPDPTTPAQNPAMEADADVPGQDIVVTARRRDESKQDVPLVVNAVTADQINKLNIRQFDEVVKVVPGLTIQQNANGIGSTTTVRGVKFDVNASGNNGTVEYYLNDAPISAGFVLQSVFDIGQIELLRGPQGTLRGRASPSGSITVTTRRPDMNEWGGFVSGTGTGNGAINAQAAVGLPIVPDVFAIRIAGIVDNNDLNEVRSIYNAPNPYSRTRAIRASGRLDPLDGLSINVMYQRLQQKIRSFDQVESISLTNAEAGIQPTTPIQQTVGLFPLNPTGLIPGNPNAGNVLIRAEDRRAAGNAPRNITQDFEIWNANADWRIAGQRLVYVFNRASQRLQSQENADRGDLFGPSFVAALQNYGQSTDSRAQQTSHELRLQSDERLFGMVDYVFGGLINQLDAPTTLTIPTPVFGLGFVPSPPAPFPGIPFAFTPGGAYPTGTSFLLFNNTAVNNRARTLENSLFGNVTLHFGQGTELSGGGRYIKYKDRGQTIVGGATIRDTNDEFSAWIYSVNAKHRFSDDLMVYASVGSSWRPPATAVGDFSICQFNAVFTPILSCADQAGFRRTQPERSTSYELGFKSNWFDRRLTLNATVFHQKFSNFVYRSPGAGAPFVNFGLLRTVTPNVPTQNVQTFNFISGVPVTVNGVEVEASFKVSDNFDIGGSFTWAEGKIKNGRIPCADANNDGRPDTTEALPTLASFNALGRTIQSCVVNQRANDAPVFSGNVQAEYRAPIGDWGQGFVRGLFTYYGNSQGDPLNQFDQVKGYGLLDLFVGLRDPDGAWEVQAFAKNLTNTYRTLSRTAPITTSVAFTSAQSANVFTNYRSVSSTALREFGLNVRYAFGSR